jgi:membrane-associated phospholipid phosphatase
MARAIQCPTMPPLRQRFFWIVLLFAALCVAAGFDLRVASWVHDHNLHNLIHHARWPLIAKWPGHYGYCTLPLAAVVAFATRHRWRGAALVAGSGIVAGLLYTIAKWFVGRTRPFPTHGPVETPFTFHPFNHGIAGLWKAENQAFPSGHTCLAFATAVALAQLFPRGRFVFFLIALLTAVERVIEGAHYPSDVIAGAIFGIAAAWITDWALGRLWSDKQDHVSSGAIAEVPAGPAGNVVGAP